MSPAQSCLCSRWDLARQVIALYAVLGTLPGLGTAIWSEQTVSRRPSTTPLQNVARSEFEPCSLCDARAHPTLFAIDALHFRLPSSIDIPYNVSELECADAAFLACPPRTSPVTPAGSLHNSRQNRRHTSGTTPLVHPGMGCFSHTPGVVHLQVDSLSPLQLGAPDLLSSALGR